MHFKAITLAFVALSFATSATPCAAADPHDLAGVWWTRSYHPRLLPINQATLPFTAEGKALYSKNLAGLKSGAIIDQADYACVPQGMPRAMTSAYPFQIILNPNQVVFAHEQNRAYRIVAFTDQHQDSKIWDPAFMGEAIATWNGDTLVIDSTNFKSNAIYLDSSGVPVSDKLHLSERIRLLDGGRRLEDLITVDDPVIFTKPWTARLVFERHDDIRVQTDWVCGERHRNVSAVLGGSPN